MATRVAACLLNVSEALNKSIVESIAASATNQADYLSSDHSVLKSSSTVLNIFNDKDYNRSVITIAGPLQCLADSVYRACQSAFEQINLSKHSGGHPRLGAVDLVPVHPLSEDVSLEDCGAVAKNIAERLAANIPGTSFFLFGESDSPLKRSLVQRRKEVGWYHGRFGMDYSALKFDVGSSPCSRYGLTGIGASPYVMNCNVTIATQDFEFGRHIASKIRATAPSGLPGVQSMAFKHEGQIEIACNVESTVTWDESREKYVYTHTDASTLTSLVERLASERSVKLVGTALVGFSPQEALHQAQHALATGQRQFWKTRSTITM
ncbi:glutamate formimidoyltransferase-like [Anneissia japonica]|uniref:glutamate formimidoyltransferase-like n=1 Tax=Anneissia japonica TaxID=1529436 RepID=UPI001425A9F3|nr:glutamate formimidoyltransferase-like [Anneissia japonica]